MKVEELNNVSTDNINTKPIMRDNLVRSDELDVGENNYDYGESLYARNKRAKKITKVTLVTVSVVTGAALLTTSIGATVLGKVPEISNYSHQVIDNHTFIHFEEKNEGRGKVYLTLFNLDVIKMSVGDLRYQGEYSVTGTYDVELELEYNHSYQVQFIVANDFDYYQKLDNHVYNLVINDK